MLILSQILTSAVLQTTNYWHINNLHNLLNVMMCRKNNERSLRAALDGTRHINTRKHTAVEALGLNQYVRDTSVEDLDLHFEHLKLGFEVLNLPFEGVGEYPQLIIYHD